MISRNFRDVAHISELKGPNVGPQVKIVKLTVGCQARTYGLELNRSAAGELGHAQWVRHRKKDQRSSSWKKPVCMPC